MLAGCARSAPAPVVLKGLAPPPKSASTAEEVGIVVDRGDTLYSVAGRANTSVRGLIEANGLTPPYVLAVGRTLRVPRSRFHTVAAGDTVYAISRRYGLDMFSLVRANGLKPPHTITIGQRLRLPGVSAARVPAPRAPPGPPAPSAQIARAPPATPSVPRAAAEFSWPVNGRILSEFGPKPGGLHNDGINIAVARGMPVRVARTGVVVYAGNELRGFGHLLLVRHDGGWMTAYAHNDRLLVARGQRVRQGEVIAHAGASGSVGAPQLHFEIRKGTEVVDPLSYLPRRTSRLSPRPWLHPGGRPSPG